MVDGQVRCFCLPGYEGSPPARACALPDNPCDPSPCGPNTQCSILENGFSKCSCLTGYIESPNTIRGCVPKSNPCQPNPCGLGALCDINRDPPCYCPESTVGNPYRTCSGKNETILRTRASEKHVFAINYLKKYLLSVPARVELCSPGPCGVNADCYVSGNQEECYCKPGYFGNAYSGCQLPAVTPCQPNPCGPNAECRLALDNQALCECAPGTSGDPTSALGCNRLECTSDDECSLTEACIGNRCRNPCLGSCGVGANCRVDVHHPVCSCKEGLFGNPMVRCSPQHDNPPSPCQPSPCGANTVCQVMQDRAVCSCLPDFLGDPQSGCHAECTINSDCSLDKACLNMKCVNPCSLGTLCGANAECSVAYHTATCTCIQNYFGNPFIRCMQRRK